MLIFASVKMNAQNTFGVQAGANFGSLIVKDGGEEQKTDSKVGINIGLVADIDFGNAISFRPELNFIQKGAQLKSESTEQGFKTKSENNQILNYIQLSPNFVYNFEAGSGKAFVGVGPEIAFGISGKVKSSFSVTGTGVNESGTTETKIKFDGDEDANDENGHLNALDYGANILAGYKFANNLYISTGYTLGLANIAPGGDKDNSAKNRGFNIKIGFFFGGNSSED